MKINNVLISSTLSLVMLSACSTDTPPEKIDEPEQKVDVSVITLKATTLAYDIESYGQLQAAETVEIGAESSGTVSKLFVREGQSIVAGDQLFALDATKQALRAEQALAAVAEAKSNVKKNQLTWQRLSALRGSSATSKEHLQQARSSFDTARARLRQAQAQASIAATELAERQVVSPVNGVVESEQLEVGQQVQAGRTLLVIQADGALQVSSFVNEDEVIQLKMGQRATVEVAGAQSSARIESIAASARATTGNYEVKLRLEQRLSGLREGMSVRVTLPVKSRQQVVLIPRTALVDRHRKRVVFVYEDGQARSREVHLGLPNGDSYPVLFGLDSGEQLITGPMTALTDGAAVVVKGS